MTKTVLDANRRKASPHEVCMPHTCEGWLVGAPKRSDEDRRIYSSAAAGPKNSWRLCPSGTRSAFRWRLTAAMKPFGPRK